MSMLRVLIADDEPLARARLAALLTQCDEVELVAQAADADSAWETCAQTQADVLLLDIDMPGGPGTELATRLSRLPHAPQVIFCTAHAQHAAHAFEVGAADYVLKPVRLARLREALERAMRLRGRHADAAPAEALVVRLRDEQRRIPLNDVIYLAADDKYVTVHHAHGEALTESSLRSLHQAHPDQLVRVHRNCLVAVQRMLGLKTLADGRVVVRLSGSDAMPDVSRRNLPALRRVLRNG